MKKLGIILLLAGVATLIYAGIGYAQRDGMDTGAMGTHAIENSNSPVPAILGTVLLLTGLVLVMRGRHRDHPEHSVRGTNGLR